MTGAGAQAAILNAGPGSWAFEDSAEQLSRALWLPVQDSPAPLTYLLGWDEAAPPPGTRLFIPFNAIQFASDKRLQTDVFTRTGVSTPRTHLLDDTSEVEELLRRETAAEWVLKWPTGCGAAGHRIVVAGEPLPEGWPRPYIVQEFIRMKEPAVYRLYAAGGELFGWNVRRFPPGVASSPWVAHARGARYAEPGPVPAEAERQGRTALVAAGLLDSFGCVDLLPVSDGRWVVLEVGTDGIFNHVDRDLGIPSRVDELDRRIAEAFWSRIGDPPWAPGPWRRRASGTPDI